MTTLTRRALAGLLASLSASLTARGEATGAPARDLPARGYASGPYGLVHYRDTGHGNPLVLLHQAPMTCRQFDSVYGLLAAAGIRAIGIDAPGYGMSDAIGFEPAIEHYARVVPPVLDRLGISKSSLLGHHTGALTATEVALQYPGRVRRLIMNQAMPLDDEERKKWIESSDASEKRFAYLPDGSHLTAAFNERFEPYGRRAGHDPDPKLITRYVVEKFMGFAPFGYGHYAAFRYDHNTAIARIRCPTLILTNTGDLLYKHSQRAKEMRPDFAYVELPGGGVDIVDQQPQAWTAAVVSFLNG